MVGRARSLAAGIAVGALLLSGVPGPAGAAVTAGPADAPSAKKLARGAVDELGNEAVIAALLALALGYDTPQVVDAMQSHTLVASGAITDANGMEVPPAGSPSPLLIGDDLSAPLSVDALRDAAPDERRLAIVELMDILVAAGRGYSADDIIVEGLLNDGFGTGFTPPGVINGIPRPDAAPDPDLLGDLLQGVRASEGPDLSGAMVGVVELGRGWQSSTSTGPAAVRRSKVRLRIDPVPAGGEQASGSYSFTVDAPGIVGQCSAGLKYFGTFSLPSDEIGFSGTGFGEGTYLSTGAVECSRPELFNADWSISILRTSDTSVSGQMTYRALTVTFTASLPSR